MKSTILVTYFAATGSLIDLRVIDVVLEKSVNGLGDGTTSPNSTLILQRVSRKMTLTVLLVSIRTLATSRSYQEINDEWIAVGLVDSTGLFFFESDCSFWDVPGCRPV